MKEILRKLKEAGFEAYIVGGYTRDKLLGKESYDIDICTSATLDIIEKLFKGKSYKEYGSFHMEYNEYEVEITTYRRELKYKDNKPIKIEKADDLYTDLLRRDFTINTLCLDIDDNLVDLLNAMRDLDKKIIKCVGDTNKRLSEDNTRILRAIKYMSLLEFKLDKEILSFIKNNKKSISDINYNRKKKELDEIFSSNSLHLFFDFVKKYNLTDCFDIKYDEIIFVPNYLAIWAQLEYSSDYPFTKDEKAIIKAIKSIIKKGDITTLDIYKYGYDVSSSASIVLNLESKFNECYTMLPINSIMDIDITLNEVMEITKIGDIKRVSNIFKKIENDILEFKLFNKKSEIIKYLNDMEK